MRLILDDYTTSSDKLADILTEQEKVNSRRQTSSGAYRAWLLGRWAVKAAGAALWGVPAEQLAVANAPEGWPELRCPGQANPAGFITLSHTNGAAAAAATTGPERPGIDLERLDRKITGRLADWAFTAAEINLAEKASPGYPGLLAVWCAKEAAAKSWGLGLLNHLSSVRVASADWPALSLMVQGLGDRHNKAQVDLKICDGFLVALANPSKKVSLKDEYE